MVQSLTSCRANKGGGEVYSGKGLLPDTVKTRYTIENINFISVFHFLRDGVN